MNKKTKIQNKQDFNGRICTNAITGRNQVIVVLPDGMSIYEALLQGIYNAERNIDFDTFIHNPKRFKLVE